MSVWWWPNLVGVALTSFEKAVCFNLCRSCIRLCTRLCGGYVEENILKADKADHCDCFVVVDVL